MQNNPNQSESSIPFGIFILATVLLVGCSGPDPFATEHPLTAPQDGASQIVLIDETFQTEPLSAGWGHRTFFAVTPTRYSIENIDNRSVLQCQTDNSGSILARHTDIQLSDYPMLSWSWKIATPIESDLDEDSQQGDDHPARFFVRFAGEDGTRRAVEIIWSNKKYVAGDYKIINDFYHYVANGLNQNVGTWHDQSIDLMQVYKDIGGTAAEPTLTLLGFFCDSDNTGAESLAYFSDVRLEK